jgi:hypothetical protein
MNPDLTSIAGIVAITIVLVEILKRFFGWVQRRSGSPVWPILGAAPTWVWAVGVSVLLTVLANRILHVLPGGFWALLVQAIGAAATAGGFVEWRRTGMTSIDESKTAVQTRIGRSIDPEDADSYSLNSWGWLVVGCGLMLACGGCADSGFVAGIEAQWKPIRSDYVRYVEGDSRLTATDKKLRNESAEMMDRLIAAEKSRLAATTRP